MNDLYVAGIGASAGGLAALKLLLEHVPAKSGVAFVLIQHPAADHRSALGILRPDEDSNAELYGRKLTNEQIVMGKTKVPRTGAKLVAELNRYSAHSTTEKKKAE